MTGFNTQVTAGNYQIQVYTDNPTVYEMVQDYIRRCLDWEQGYQTAREVSRLEERSR